MHLLLATLHPVPPPQAPSGSVAGWIWVMVALAIVVAGGVVLTSRR